MIATHLSAARLDHRTLALPCVLFILDRAVLLAISIHVQELCNSVNGCQGRRRRVRTSTTLPTKYGKTLFCLIFWAFSAIFSFIWLCSCMSLKFSCRIICRKEQREIRKTHT